MLQPTNLIIEGGSVAGDSGTIKLRGTFQNAGSYQAGSSTVSFADSCASGPARIVGPTTFANSRLQRLRQNTRDPKEASIAVTGTLTLQAVPGAPISIVTASGAPVNIALSPGATVVQSNVTVAPGVTIGAAVTAVPAPRPNFKTLRIAHSLLAAG